MALKHEKDVLQQLQLESEPPRPSSKGGRVVARFRRQKEEIKLLNRSIQAVQMLESGQISSEILSGTKGKRSFEGELAKEVKADMLERIRHFLTNCPSEKLDPDAALGRLHPPEEENLGKNAADALKAAALP